MTLTHLIVTTLLYIIIIIIIMLYKQFTTLLCVYNCGQKDLLVNKSINFQNLYGEQ